MIKLFIITAALALTPIHTLAGTVTPHPEPNPTGSKYPDKYVDYTGHYGEVLKLEDGWRIRWFLKGDAEIVDVFLPYDLDDPNDPDLLKRFDPAPSFFIPKNFSRYRLMRLSIQPARGLSLAKMKAEKAAELDAAGAHFKIFDQPFSNDLNGTWPKGSFVIDIDSPYELTELYTASPSFLCILTSGVETPPSTVMSHNHYWMRSSLRDWVAKQSAGTELEGPPPAEWFKPSPAAQAAYLMESRGFQLLLMIVLACALLSAIPGSWPYARRVSWTARFALLGAAGTFLAGEVLGVILALIPFKGPIHSILFVELVLDAALAVGAYRLSLRPERRDLRRSFLAIITVCVLHLAVSMIDLPGSGSSADGLILQSGFASSLVGLLAGSAFGLFFLPGKAREQQAVQPPIPT